MYFSLAQLSRTAAAWITRRINLLDVIHGILLLIECSLTFNQLIDGNRCKYVPFGLMDFLPHAPEQQLLSGFASILPVAIVGCVMKHRPIKSLKQIGHRQFRR